MKRKFKKSGGFTRLVEDGVAPKDFWKSILHAINLPVNLLLRFISKGRKKPTPSFTTGFMLIEVIVATTLFVVVMTVAATAILGVVDATRKAQAISTIMTNLHFVLEDISRQVRAGELSACTGGSPCTQIDIDQQLRVVTYAYDATNKKITQQINDAINGLGPLLDLTSPQEVVLEDVEFYVSGVGDDNLQPRVLIVIRGHTVGKENVQSPFNLQTSVTQRIDEIADF